MCGAHDSAWDRRLYGQDPALPGATTLTFPHCLQNVDFSTGRRQIREDRNLKQKENSYAVLSFMIPGVYQPKNNRTVDAHFTPNAEMMAKMGQFNEEL